MLFRAGLGGEALTAEPTLQIELHDARFEPLGLVSDDVGLSPAVAEALACFRLIIASQAKMWKYSTSAGACA